MKYKFYNKSTLLKTRSTKIKILKGKNNHALIEVYHDDNEDSFISFKQLTNVKMPLTQFEKKCTLIEVYKLLDDYLLFPNILKSQINNLNYAKVFGSPWL